MNQLTRLGLGKKRAPGNVRWHGLAKNVEYRRRDIEAAPNTLVAPDTAMGLDIANPMSTRVSTGAPKRRGTDQSEIFMHQRKWCASPKNSEIRAAPVQKLRIV